MTIEVAHFCLVLALVVAVFQAIIGMVGASLDRERLLNITPAAAIVQFLLVALSFIGLTRAFLQSDFSVKIVYENSHSAKPFLYKFAGVWGNHEGSMLLWILMLAFLGAMVALFASNLPKTFRARVLAVQGGIASAFLSFSIFTSNPFARFITPPFDGRDLNPLLQDPGLAFHPPFLYFGYVGFSVAFSFAVAALLEGRVDTRWARWVRPWTLLAWSSLTLGIAMGAWWAYYELGWGGFWFWDPVENASLMPWLAGTALLHSAIVVEKRDSLKVWTVLMAIIAFATSLMGTFLVRSGLLTSVHAFANDPLRGQFLLLIFFAITGAALILFALKANSLSAGGRFQIISREGALVGNNLILSTILFTVFLGTFWPKFSDMIFNRAVSVGPPYFNAITIPLMFMLILLMTLGSLASWKRASFAKIMGRLKWAILLSVAMTLLILWVTRGGPLLAVVGAFMAIWVIVGVGVDVAGRSGFMRIGFGDSLRRLIKLPLSFWGGAMAHMGVGIVILGMTGTALWVSEEAAIMQPGDKISIAGYEVRFDGLTVARVSNYETETGAFSLLKADEVVATLNPERRWYPVAEQATTEAAITPRFASDIYIALGEPRENGQIVRVWHHPLVYLMWVGSLVMTFGGVLSLFDRRFRYGVPIKSKAGATVLASNAIRDKTPISPTPSVAGE